MDGLELEPVGPEVAVTDQVISRTPVDDGTFTQISEYYEYDRTGRPLPLHAEVLSTQTHNGGKLPYLIDKIHFRSIHDEVVVGYFAYQRDTTDTRYPAVILLHGNNRFRGSQGTWARGWLDLLAREGYCALAIDQYGFGERLIPGKALDFFGDMGLYEMRDVTIQHVVDARRAIDYLSTRSEVDATRIALMGESLGGLNICLTAGLESRLAAVVLVVAGPSFSSTDHPFYRLWHTLNFAPHIGAPVLLVNATHDRYYSVESVEELYAAIPEPKRLVWHEGEHGIPVEDQEREIMPWLGKLLK